MDSRRNIVCDCCFKDSQLIAFIKENGEIGDCPWCGARDVYVARFAELGDLFRDVAFVYVPAEGLGGDDISFLLQEDWEAFSDNIAELTELLQDMSVTILQAGLDPKDLLYDHADYGGSFRREDPWLEQHWHDKAEAFLSGEEPYVKEGDSYTYAELDNHEEWPDYLEIAFEDLASSYDPGHILYRARIHKDRSRTERFISKEIGAPPPEATPGGKANRPGYRWFPFLVAERNQVSIPNNPFLWYQSETSSRWFYCN